MSGTVPRGGDTSPIHQPRQSRTHSVGLPTRASLLPEPPFTGNDIGAPPIPRRHSATPTVAPPPIPLRAPAIPKRNKNERPITLQKVTPRSEPPKKQEQSRGPPPPKPGPPPKIPPAPWHHPDADNDEKLIDLDTRKDTKEYHGAPPDSGRNNAIESVLGQRDGFAMAFGERRTKDAERSSFEDLQKASKDLEKRLHERFVRCAEPKRTDLQGAPAARQRRGSTFQNERFPARERSKFEEGPFPGAESKFEELSSSLERRAPPPPPPPPPPSPPPPPPLPLLPTAAAGHERSKFEELQAAARDLEKRLHERNSRYDDQPRHFSAQERSKFEELQNASRDLEKRLHERILAAGGEQQRVAKYEADMERARSMLQNGMKKEKTEKLPKATQTNIPPPLSAICQSPAPKPISVRQDSNVSSDSFSQTSSPSYTSKTMEAPLLPHKHINGKVPGRALAPELENPPGSPITKSMSTPASLQTIVRFHSGSNMSLHHRIIRDMRRPSSHYTVRGKFRFRFAQVLVNAVALLAIAGGLTAYFKSYPTYAVRFENKTVYAKGLLEAPAPVRPLVEPKNPAPGICLPVIVSFCQDHKIPYNFTVFPNYVGNFGQRDAQYELEVYNTVVDVKCYELAALFLCSVFVPKCGSRGQVVRPCRSLCFETKRRCGFFLEIFSLSLLDHLECDLFPENADPDECIGHHEVIEAAKRAEKPVCTSGFQCDNTKCIPVDYRCDGHLDCADQTDEIGCGECESTNVPASDVSKKGKKSGDKSVLAKQFVHCGEKRCMSTSHICDGVVDCPWGQDERNCLRLSERHGDVGIGRLEVYHAEKSGFEEACITTWGPSSAKNICLLLGYTAVDDHKFASKGSYVTRPGPISTTSDEWSLDQKNLLKEFQSCTDLDTYTTVHLACSLYACGRRIHLYGNMKPQLRIVGGVESAPGDWPFLAALLGGPEEVFYCAGVLIADQWVLTASHCVGNHSDVSSWTIQLGITRRHAHTFLGQKVKVKRVVSHPSYKLGVTHDNDVALFQLENPVRFNEHLRPVCLPDATTELKPGTVCTVIGWGKKEDTDDSEYEPAVNEVKVPVLKRELCNQWLVQKEVYVTDGMICAGYPDGGKDACQGDSGGPLLCQDEHDEERWFVGGIVSWGVKCAHPKLPGVYAYVPKYVPWIRREIDKYSEMDKG